MIILLKMHQERHIYSCNILDYKYYKYKQNTYFILKLTLWLNKL